MVSCCGRHLCRRELHQVRPRHLVVLLLDGLEQVEGHVEAGVGPGIRVAGAKFTCRRWLAELSAV